MSMNLLATQSSLHYSSKPAIDALTTRLESNPALLRRVTFLGTSSAVPCPGRCNVSSLIVNLSSGSSIMVDCGEATQHQIMRSKSVRMGKIDVILITHLHGDHFFGLFGLLATIGTHGRTDPITVVGPKGLKLAIESVFIAGEGITEEDKEPSYALEIIELDVPEPCIIKNKDDAFIDTPYVLNINVGVDIIAVPIEHRVPCYGYIIQERTRTGTLNAKKAKEMGVMPVQMKTLKDGIDVTVADGSVVHSRDVTEAPVIGRKLVVLQDTHDASKYAELFHQADVMIHECTYHDDMKVKAIECGHSTPSMAADLATKCQVNNLILTHFSSRYDKELLKYSEDKSSVVFCPPKSSYKKKDTMDDTDGANTSDNEVIEPPPTKKQAPVVMTVLDLQNEAKEYLQKVGNTHTRVLLAADFRVYDSDKHGVWTESQEADVDLSKMF